MSYPVYIVDIIGEAVAAAECSVLATLNQNEANAVGRSNIVNVNYQKGHKLELIETLAQWSLSRNFEPKKYPCIYLVQDFQESRGPRPGVYADVSLTVIIMHHTEQTHKVDDRYTKVFKPVLYPLYYAFLEALAKHSKIMQSNGDDIQHTKTDRLYWGRQAAGGNDKVALTDFLDAIEITGLRLSFYFNNCKICANS